MLRHGKRDVVAGMYRPAIHEMACCRPVIQVMTGQDHPSGELHVLQEKDANKIGKYITHLRSLISSPIDHFL